MFKTFIFHRSFFFYGLFFAVLLFLSDTFAQEQHRGSHGLRSGPHSHDKQLPQQQPQVSAFNSEKRACPLEQFGNEFSADKVDQWHNYQILYCELFTPFRNDRVNMLEIGFGCGHHIHGSGALMWNKFFPNLNYFAVDLLTNDNQEKVLDCVATFQKEHPNKLRKIWLGNSGEQHTLKKIIKETRQIGITYDIIVDDGGHDYGSQIAAFEYLWPLVSPGGYYIKKILLWPESLLI